MFSLTPYSHRNVCVPLEITKSAARCYLRCLRIHVHPLPVLLLGTNAIQFFREIMHAFALFRTGAPQLFLFRVFRHIFCRCYRFVVCFFVIGLHGYDGHAHGPGEGVLQHGWYRDPSTSCWLTAGPNSYHMLRVPTAIEEPHLNMRQSESQQLDDTWHGELLRVFPLVFASVCFR